LTLGLVHVALHAGKAREVAVDVVLGRLLLDAQVAGQPEGAHAVDEAEVDDLGVAALLAADTSSTGTCRRPRWRWPVHVQPSAKAAAGRVLADVGHDAQLDLE
jgi:hypothetical protein